MKRFSAQVRKREVDMLHKFIHGYPTGTGRVGDPPENHDIEILEPNIIGTTYIEFNRIELVDVFPDAITVQVNGAIRHICRKRSHAYEIECLFNYIDTDHPHPDLKLFGQDGES